METLHRIKTSMEAPEAICSKEYAHSSFREGKPFDKKKTGRLPAMGWNSWNAFGSGNTEALTKAMADKMIELGLDKLGYEYLVLDDGCYLPERVDGKLANEPVKFPNGFKALSDYIHGKGLKFGMYNDVGTNLCAGARVGTCGFEDVDAVSYVSWGVDFLKVDNCYYPWDNATFSNPENARFTYAPNIKSIKIVAEGFEKKFDAVSDGVLIGRGAEKHANGYVTNLGTFDGTNVGNTPVGDQSGELVFNVEVPQSGNYSVVVEYATAKHPGVGEWLQVAVGNPEDEVLYFDAFLQETETEETFVESQEIEVKLLAGANVIRLMNHRRQENTLNSYAAMFFALQAAKPDNDIVLSLCEWGKTMPHNWGYKMGDSWRILNDITFWVGGDGNPGGARWDMPGTDSITSQYDKAVVMDRFAGLDKGWNDPDMMVIGMNGITNTMAKSHMAMWCMLNSPLMLGLDLRRVEKGDEIYNIIANKELIALNQDALGIQARRVFCTLEKDAPDMVYITNDDRVDILAKPLANGDVALLFQNLSQEKKEGDFSITMEEIIKSIGENMVDVDKMRNAASFAVKDLWTGEEKVVDGGKFAVSELEACDNVALRISAK